MKQLAGVKDSVKAEKVPSAQCQVVARSLVAKVKMEDGMLERSKESCASSAYHTNVVAARQQGLSKEQAKFCGQQCSQKFRSLWKGAVASALAKGPKVKKGKVMKASAKKAMKAKWGVPSCQVWRLCSYCGCVPSQILLPACWAACRSEIKMNVLYNSNRCESKQKMCGIHSGSSSLLTCNLFTIIETRNPYEPSGILTNTYKSVIILRNPYKSIGILTNP